MLANTDAMTILTQIEQFYSNRFNVLLAVMIAAIGVVGVIVSAGLNRHGVEDERALRGRQ